MKKTLIGNVGFVAQTPPQTFSSPKDHPSKQYRSGNNQVGFRPVMRPKFNIYPTWAIFILALLLTFLAVAYPVKAFTGSVEKDESIFVITNCNGQIGEESFRSLSELESILSNPIIAETQIKMNCSLKLKSPPPKYVHFLRLHSQLIDPRWNVEPAELKEVEVWSNYSQETYLWVPSSQHVHEMTIMLSGRMPHPTAVEIIETDEGAKVERTLIKEGPREILFIEVRKSMAEFRYSEDPKAWIDSSLSESNVFKLTGIVTNKIIEEAKVEIKNMEKALALLTDPDGDIQKRLDKMPGEVRDTLKSLIEKEEILAEFARSLFEKGYPSQASEVADRTKKMAQETRKMVDNVWAKIGPSEQSPTNFIIYTFIFLFVVVAAIVIIIPKRVKQNDIAVVRSYLNSHMGETINSNIRDRLIKRLKGER